MRRMRGVIAGSGRMMRGGMNDTSFVSCGFDRDMFVASLGIPME